MLLFIYISKNLSNQEGEVFYKLRRIACHRDNRSMIHPCGNSCRDNTHYLKCIPFLDGAALVSYFITSRIIWFSFMPVFKVPSQSVTPAPVCISPTTNPRHQVRLYQIVNDIIFIRSFNRGKVGLR